jgi:hypothetical protein
MTDLNKKLARIKSAKLEIQERGILNFWLYVDYEDGLSQGVGGIALDTYDSVLKSRVGTAYGCEVIRQLLLELQVNDFSEMADKKIWVLGEGSGLSFTPKGVQSLNVDNSESKPVIWKDILEMFEKEK